MATYRVKPDQLLPHEGVVYAGGAIVEIPRHVGAELPHLVEEVDASGAVVASREPWEIALEQHRRHEHVGVLTRAKADGERRLADAMAMAARAQAAVDQADAYVQKLRAGVERVTAALIAAQTAEIPAAAP